MRIAAADIGTNSCRLLIAEVIEGRLVSILKKITSTRLGEGLLESGWLHPKAIKRTVDCLLNFRDIMHGYQVSAYRVVATSAVREAVNREDFLAVAEEETGLSIEVIGGEEEASLAWEGVVRSLNFSELPLVADLGAGSTEFIYAGQSPVIKSVKVGAVKATEGDWSREQIRAALEEVLALAPRFRKNPLVLTGGTPTTLVAIKKGLAEYDPDLVHGQKLTYQEVEDLYQMLEGMPLNLRRRLPGLQPERADIVVKGVLIVLVIMDGLGKDEIIVSESDLLEGIIWRLAGASPGV
ncbi:MAG: Ppx/GppA family phosphatase [Syntrophothermus sp.]|uniref:Ppx/GppA phosphatase family protein n=1 Tax=Syntrophothermus sp. TaxID=2736299 RepID=UPI002579D3C6|nr:Ppx/GppA phosphatase family protein [Syntrophothermus sp.]NSW84150.1 Ppx/GppA family phosphatase [Syntrophothermus sp.]